MKTFSLELIDVLTRQLIPLQYVLHIKHHIQKVTNFDILVPSTSLIYIPFKATHSIQNT